MNAAGDLQAALITFADTILRLGIVLAVVGVGALALILLVSGARRP